MQFINNDKLIHNFTNLKENEKNNFIDKYPDTSEKANSDQKYVKNSESKFEIKGNGFHKEIEHEISTNGHNSNGNSSENQTENKHENHRVLPTHEDKVDFLNSVNTVEVTFQGSRKEFYFNPLKEKVHPGELVIVETENGCDIGKVTNTGELIYKKWSLVSKINKTPVYSIKYKAGQKEKSRYEENLREQKKILDFSKELIKKHNLEMKITEVEWQFDRHRLTIFFLAPQRIDFRELVKELAKEYKTRIELRQITHRERARRITMWEGVCGRSICCSSFLHHIQPITIEHSKIQQLSANVTKLSGYCGRLKCCLSFEYDFYLNESERFPKLGSILDLDDTSLKLIKFDIFKDNLTFFSEEKRIFRNFSLSEVNEFAKQHKILEPKDSMCGICEEFENNEELKELLSLQD